MERRWYRSLSYGRPQEDHQELANTSLHHGWRGRLKIFLMEQVPKHFQRQCSLLSCVIPAEVHMACLTNFLLKSKWRGRLQAQNIIVLTVQFFFPVYLYFGAGRSEKRCICCWFPVMYRRYSGSPKILYWTSPNSSHFCSNLALEFILYSTRTAYFTESLDWHIYSDNFFRSLQRYPIRVLRNLASFTSLLLQPWFAV